MSNLPLTGPPLGRQRLRASIYVRLSNAADDSNTSLENMIAECRAVLARENFEEVALHVDDGITGGVRDRPEFIAWLDDARYQRCEVLVAHHVDRMTREGLNVAAMILDVQEGKDPATGRVVRPPVRLMDTKGVDSNGGIAFRMMFVIKAETAREERERIRERLAGRATRLRLAGRWPGGEVPFGFEIVPNVCDDGKVRGKTLAKCEKEAGAIREAASRILSGHTLGRVCRWLNYEGPPPRRAAQWSRVTLRQTLTGDHILGRVTVGGVVQRDADGHAFAPFPAILDLPTVAALRKALAPSADHRKAPGRLPSRLASRLVECSSCHHYLYVVTTKQRYEVASGEVRESVTVVYRCQQKADGKRCDRPVIASAIPFERYLERRFLADFGHAPAFEERTTVPDDGALAAVEEALAATLSQLAEAATPETFARLQSLQAERDRLAELPSEPVTVRVPTGRTLAEEWHARDVEGKRELLESAYELIRLHPGKRGGRGHFDPARLELVEAEGLHDPDF
ncbi:recombinase family protein [Micromonospora sp. KC213]|uniref:recombinase family protein n=1 Tax=Micromonospora sp. KC213 TaxID=2530378 RepID=UPI0010466906|nr:recombinase family protein [Micromonospora sp. KC213]TDC29713.1 recombinase family protein [Micromonospora sp. KC213]